MAQRDNIIEEALGRLAPDAKNRTAQVFEAAKRTNIPERKWYRFLQARRVAGQPRDLFLLEELTGIPARRLAGFAATDGGGHGPPRSKGTKARSKVVRPRAWKTTPAATRPALARAVGA